MDRHSFTKTRSVNRRGFLKASFAAGGVLATSSLIELGLTSSRALASPVPSLKASISIDAGHVRHTINPHIYGAFIEHVDRCIYGGVYQEGLAVSDAQGFRKDVMSAASEWGIPILRWPGGVFANTYHWEDGVGPKASRAQLLNRSWNEPESNHFGTDEFIEYCRKIGADPYICINLQSGTAQEAANWVEYCNGTADTRYANLRRKNGHPQPHGVRYWGLGNEPWQMPTDKYINAAFEFGKRMKEADPSIRLVACGMAGLPPEAFKKIGLDPDWNRKVLEKLIDIADYLSTHEYEGNDDYYEELGSVKRFEDNLKSMSTVIDQVLARTAASNTNRRIGIAYDEWNIWFRKKGLPPPHGIEEAVDEKYNLKDALWVASILNLFQRMSDRVTMANLATVVNAIGAMYTSDRGMFRQTIFFPMKLYRRECGSLALRSEVDSPVFSTTSLGEVGYLDVSATLDDKHKVMSIAVVNRHREESIRTTLKVMNARVRGLATVFEINGASPEVENSFTEPENVKTVQKRGGDASGKFDYVFPPHSVTLLKLTLA